ncbi:MAG: UDP-N-acetylmuramate:L-alanyl-gamma-D-glutamyl-meso-diaminopimelate ligase [Deltaproteobacteria bacterium]|nr:MAG: UDP-N-acetylmuramate:L-alanyl-gamma-D-glutamyl-meso-diaminopimelate ligase [Deltaproteobacteria bacterium]
MDKVKHIHLIAVCGTGMGSLAGMLKESGYQVTGSDTDIYPPMSDQLASQGIEIRSGYKPENLRDNPDLVIVGNAVPRDNPEVEAMLEKGIKYLSFPQALSQFFLAGKTPLVIVGTHGKTTTSSLSAWILKSAGRDPGFLIGGVINNFRSSYRLGNGNCFVVEGDEYDSAFFDKEPKFLHYRPQIAILTSIEFDHADIYRNLEEIKSSFRKFVDLLPENGLLLACIDDPGVREIADTARCPVQWYGLDPEALWRAEEISFAEDGTAFSLHQGNENLSRIQSPLSGKHNLHNLLGVIGACRSLGLSLSKIQEGLKGFEGVKRRQEVKGTVNGITVIDDFAHHPTAVKKTIDAMKHKYPGRRLWAVFEPRTASSRRKVFQDQYPDAFLEADRIIIADVYKAEKIVEEERFSPELIVRELVSKGKEATHLGKADDIVSYLTDNLRKEDVVLIMSNGDFGGIVGKILKMLPAVNS